MSRLDEVRERAIHQDRGLDDYALCIVDRDWLLEQLGEVVKQLVAAGPLNNEGFACHFCSAPVLDWSTFEIEHYDDCLWRRVTELDGGAA